jgi:hypothetical protein
LTGKGYVVKQMTVQIDGTAYECEVTGVNLTETHDTQTTHTACASGTVVDVGPSSWTVDVTANVDPKAGSLWRLLMDPAKAGKAAVVTFVPDVIANPLVKVTANVTLVPPTGTFTVNAFATFTVSLPVIGTPTITDTATLEAPAETPAETVAA